MKSLLLVLFTVFSPAAWAEVLDGRVVGIADGDTLTLLDRSRQQHKIQLGGIDAPEKAQPFGQRSKRHLSELAFGRDAKADCYKVRRTSPDDRWRTLHEIDYSPRKRYLVQEGMAFALPIPRVSRLSPNWFDSRTLKSRCSVGMPQTEDHHV